MSGWWFSSSASSATRFTNAIASAEVVEAELALERAVDLAPAVRHGHAPSMHRGYVDQHSWSRPYAAQLAEAAAARPSSCASSSSARWRSSSCSCCCRCACRRPPSCSPRRRPASRPRRCSWREQLVAAALLLQLKTVLDNADGQLARAAGTRDGARALPRLRVRPARERGAVRGARARDRAVRGSRSSSFLVLDARAQRRLQPRARSTGASTASRARRGRRRPGSRPCSARIYDVVYAPQDRLVERLVERRLRGAPRRGAARLPRPRDAGGARELRALDAARGARRLPRGSARPRRTSGSRSAAAPRSSRCELRRDGWRARA